MDLQIAIDERRPLRAQVEREIRDGIRAGRLRAGARLPASRLLAQELRVSRGVIVEAYAQLIAEGYLSAHRGGGTRVAGSAARQPPHRSPHHPSPPRIRFDLRAGIPDLSLFPRRAWHAATVAALRELPDASLSYGSPQGLGYLRRTLADYLGRVRAVLVDSDQIFITCGTSHSLARLCHALARRGVRRVAVEDPAWRRIPETIAQAGLEPVAVAVDGGGLIVGDLDPLDVDAVVVSPAHQYPTGAVMDPDRRCALLDWADSGDRLIIEDDYDAEYRFDGDPIAPLQSLRPERVAYLGTASKTLAPGMRLGWVIVPEWLRDGLAMQHGVSHALPNVISQSTYGTLLARGDIDRHLRKTRRVYRQRRAALVDAGHTALPEIRVEGGSAGLHLLGWLPPEVDEDAVRAAAAQRGLAIDTLHRECALGRPSAPALVLGYGLIAASRIPAAASELAACLPV